MSEDTTQDTRGATAAGPHETSGPDGVVVRTERGDAVSGDRTDGVLSWIGWHLGELAAVGVPAVLAVTTHPLWTVPAVIVAAGWMTHEVRLARRATPKRANRAEPHGGDRAAGEASTPDAPVMTSGEEDRRGLA